MKMDRARRSASTDRRIRSSTRVFSCGSAAAVRTAMRLVTVSATTPVALEWWFSNSWDAARTNFSLLKITNTNSDTMTKRATAAGHTKTASTTMADSTTTTTGSRPHEATSTISTKAQEKLPSEEMTSPAGWSMCQR